MAHSDKNIVITPNISSTTSDPKIVFSGADASTAAQNITLQVYPTNGGTLSFEGSAGQLLSITNDLTGTIFSVNDVSGIPSIEVDDDGTIRLAEFGGNILIGTGTDSGEKLQVNGGISTPTMWVNYSTGNYNGYNENIRLYPAGNSVSVIAFGASGTSGTPWNSVLGYSDRFEIRQGTQWQQRNYADYVQAYGSFRAPIFYDSDNTAYYVNPDSTTSAILAGKVGIGTTGPSEKLELDRTAAKIGWGMNGNYGVRIGYFDNGAGVHGFHVDTKQAGTTTSESRFIVRADSGNVGIGTKAPSQLLHVVGTGYASSDFRAPIFYDSDNTAYYVNPAATSYLSRLITVNDGTFNSVTVGRGAGDVSTNTAVGASALAANTTGQYNTVFGNSTGNAITTSQQNSFFGYQSGFKTTGGNNTAIGSVALYQNTSGNNNTALGASALENSTTASYNTAVGYQAGYSNTTGTINLFVGNAAGYSNTTGGANSFAGSYAAGYFNTTGSYNTAFGQEALASNTTASNNTAVGYQAAYTNTTGTLLTAIGRFALYANTTGSYNIAVGDGALGANTTASNNTAVGYQAGYSGTTTTNNTFIGYQAGFSATTGNGRGIFIGRAAGYSNTTGTDNVYIGYFAGYTNQTGIANTYIGSGYYGSENPAGYLATGSQNTFVGYSAGNTVTTGAKNTILGGYNGNQGGLDIRTASNYIVLSDGDGNPRQIIDSSGNVGIGTSSPTTKLHVTGDTTNYGILAEQPSGYGGLNIKSTTLAQTWSFIANDNGANSDLLLYGGSSAGTKFVVDSSGNIIIGQSQYSWTNNDNAPVINSVTANRLHVNGSIQLTSNNDAIVFGHGTASFLKDEELAFGWGGGWYQTDYTYLKVRNNKILYNNNEIRGTIFGDTNNTSYYVDPASSATSANFNGTVRAKNFDENIYTLTGTALDPGNGGIQYKTLSANTTFTNSFESGESMTLKITGGATYTVTWPTMTWITSGGNVAPTLNGTDDVIVMWYDGTTLYGLYAGNGA